MKVIGIIPARAESSRFPNKPLAKILGKPMIQWTYEHGMQATRIEEVYVATDSAEIKEAVEAFGGKVIMTSPLHPTGTERIYEASQKVHADVYIVINGDEPVISGATIDLCVPPETIDTTDFYASNLMTDFENPVEVVDTTNLKIVTNRFDEVMFISRSPIPFPRGNSNYTFKKFVGISAFTKSALEFYHNTPLGEIEAIEQNDTYRFIENGKKVYYFNAHCKSISVDTPKDIELAEEYLRRNGEV